MGSTVQGETSVAELAGELGVVDALLFRRLTSATCAHLGGLGRGKGWAGLVDVADTEDHLLDKVPGEAAGVREFTYSEVGRVVGPYYAVGGAVVRVSNDVLVVLGNPTAPLSRAANPESLRRLAAVVESSVGDVAPSKRLADELEVLHAVRAVTTGRADDLAGTLAHVVEVAMESLSCEVGLLRDGAGHIAASSSWKDVDVADERVGAALDHLQELAGGGSVCVQDTDEEPVLAPLGREQGVRSLLAIAVPAPAGGILVLAHTTAGPRGFTTLCQQLGRQVAEAGSVIAHTAALREELEAAGEKHARAARRDALTGLSNRLAWDEALAQAQQQVDAGSSVTVLTLDVDGLKRVNDTCGHEAGDDLLQRCADVLRAHGRHDDVCVRLGGDEFAILMHHAGKFAHHRLAVLSAQLGGATSCERSVAASLGMATALPHGSVADAVREADALMYAAKRARRVRAGEAPGEPAALRRANDLG
jgi:diguanylate cyclase (GGDEF)-like protein